MDTRELEPPPLLCLCMTRVCISPSCCGGQRDGVGAKIAFCRDECVLLGHLQPDDTLVAIDGQDVTKVLTVEVRGGTGLWSSDAAHSCMCVAVHGERCVPVWRL